MRLNKVMLKFYWSQIARIQVTLNASFECRDLQDDDWALIISPFYETY